MLGYQYNGNGFTQKYVFCTTPNGSDDGGDGGIWQAGKGLMADAAGNIYFSVGNGRFDANTGGSDYGMCYMKLTPNPNTNTLTVASYYAPYDELGAKQQRPGRRQQRPRRHPRHDQPVRRRHQVRGRLPAELDQPGRLPVRRGARDGHSEAQRPVEQ